MSATIIFALGIVGAGILTAAGIVAVALRRRPARTVTARATGRETLTSPVDPPFTPSTTAAERFAAVETDLPGETHAAI
jgi:hypothetical protein